MRVNDMGLNMGYNDHSLRALKASTLFSRAFGLLMLGSFLTHLLRLRRNFWLTPLREAYFWRRGLLIPFW